MLELGCEMRESLWDLGGQVARSVGVEGLDPFGETHPGEWEFDNVGSPGSPTTRIAVDGLLGNGGVG